MNILILNWRDPKNPRSGGAEILNLHILKPLLKQGNVVTWYSMFVPGLPDQEDYLGIRIVRHGNLLTHFLSWPFLYYGSKFGKVDLIFDCVHGTGYWASWIAPTNKVVILVCEVAQNIWGQMWPFPINILGPVYEHVLYYLNSGKKFWTISNSTKKDLIQFGVKEANISVLPMGYDAVKLAKPVAKNIIPTAVFVGRLCAMKGVKDAVNAISKTQDWQLFIIGRGEPEYEQELKQMVSDLGLKTRITFKGFVSESEKFSLIAGSWVLLAPSTREGWGMTVPEANSVGTPAIGYNVAGLCDVLPYYSKSNLLITPGVTILAKTLTSLKKPLTISGVIPPGWSYLEKFVLSGI
jgi:glycosyltransferase involved in cell wall biosynthesis